MLHDSLLVAILIGEVHLMELVMMNDCWKSAHLYIDGIVWRKGYL
jgi:hypothetical protein